MPKTKSYEGSKADKKADKAGAKSAGLSPREGSKMDKMKDKSRGKK